MASNDLQELFSRLKAQPSDPSAQTPPSIFTQARSQADAYQQPSVSSPMFSPPIHTPNPLHSSNVLSPVNPTSAVGTPAPDQNRTNNLLNLLKFNNQGSQAGPMANLQNVGGLRSSTVNLGTPESGTAATPHARPVSAQDLMASFQRKTSAQSVLASPAAAIGAENPEPVSHAGNSKEFLLNLLTKPKAPRPDPAPEPETVEPQEQKEAVDTEVEKQMDADVTTAAIAPATEARAQRETTPIHLFGTADSQDTVFEAPQPVKASMFSYVNPFDQLHSSSPLNLPSRSAQPEPKKFEILKHDRTAPDEQYGSTVDMSATTKTVTIQEAESLPPDSEKTTSVSQAVQGVGEMVDKQVEQALAQAAQAASTLSAGQAQPTSVLNETRSTVKPDTAADTGEVDSSWESAEDEEAEKHGDAPVEVFNFPMKPFVSIHIKENPSPRSIRQKNFMHIARLKKDFDQIDRTLVTASDTHIVYAQVATKKDNGGFRVIRQETGAHKQIFRSSGERIFSVQIGASSATDGATEAVIGTGVDGSVFWTLLPKSQDENFADDDGEARGFIMPPVATSEEQTSGAQVKTRAKLSSRSSKIFAISRSKQIHLVAPAIVMSGKYCDQKTRWVDSDKYFAEHALRICAGKACKDFCFSQDDTMIASLDKSGRIKFWNIKEMTRFADQAAEGSHEPVDLRDPVWTLNAAASGGKPDEKPSVSSIMFLDKDRPMSRGIALRYMLVGFKQNHILQLWDLGLGKAVQEIRLPHEKDSDGICSLTYHPRTGIIALGHPTRNSVYFIHLSAPRYSMAHMEQAKYITLLAKGEPSLPRPESTAIMSGLREFSFAKVGHLRSLDMLHQPVESAGAEDGEEETLFELYITHSKGVVGMAVKRSDLGWDKEGKMLRATDALQADVVEVTDLVPPPKPSSPSEQTSATDTPSRQPGKPISMKAAQTSGMPAAPHSTSKVDASPSLFRAANGTAAHLETSKPATEASPAKEEVLDESQPGTRPGSYAAAVQAVEPMARGLTPSTTSKASGQDVPQPPSAPTEAQAASNPAAQINKHFESLYQRIDSDRRVQDAANSVRQEQMLRLVSDTLTKNVDNSLNRIVSEHMTKEIVPSISASVNTAVAQKISELLPQQLGPQVSKEMKAALPHAIQQSLKDSHVLNAISNNVSQKVQQQVSNLLQQSLPNLATQAAQKMVADLDARTKLQLQQAESLRQEDNGRIQELSTLVQSLSQMVQNMSESQAAFQEQILTLQRSASVAGVMERQVSRGTESTIPVPKLPKTAEEEEADKITQLLSDEEWDAATIAWLQSARQGQLFDQVFVRVNPRYLERVSPLIALSVSAAITASFESHIDARLQWLDAALNTVDLTDADIKEVAPRIMEVLSQRLNGAYLHISEASPSNPALRTIWTLNMKVMEIRRLAA